MTPTGRLPPSRATGAALGHDLTFDRITIIGDTPSTS